MKRNVKLFILKHAVNHIAKTLPIPEKNPKFSQSQLVTELFSWLLTDEENNIKNLGRDENFKVLLTKLHDFLVYMSEEDDYYRATIGKVFYYIWLLLKPIREECEDINKFRQQLLNPYLER